MSVILTFFAFLPNPFFPYFLSFIIFPLFFNDLHFLSSSSFLSYFFGTKYDKKEML